MQMATLLGERGGQSALKSVPPQADIEAATARESSAFGDPCRRKRSEIGNPCQL